MASSHRPPPNKFVAKFRRVYNPLGFSRGYNFTFWFIFGGVLLAFSLSRLMYLDIDGIFCNPDSSVGNALSGECYYYSHGLPKAGMLLHLGAVLPASILAVFQFLPVIRYKALLVYRINGYMVLLLSIASTIGVFVIVGDAFEGSLSFRTASGTSSVIFIGGQAIAYYNIKRLQIEQHRAWMIRSWVVASSIITMRFLAVSISQVIGRGSRTWYSARPCYVVDYIFAHNESAVLQYYPICANYYSGNHTEQVVLVTADTTTQRIDESTAALTMSFGPGAWLALALHILGAELYLRLTPRESERLRKVSYQRQLEAGMKNPGNAGLTVQRLGDAEPWVSPADEIAEPQQPAWIVAGRETDQGEGGNSFHSADNSMFGYGD